jgi:hypothetical protein
MQRTHLSRKEASEYTGVSAETLAKWAVLRRGPRFSKLGTGRTARVRYAISELDAFLRGVPADIEQRRSASVTPRGGRQKANQ